MDEHYDLEDIPCPKCCEKNIDNWEFDGIVTVWGEDGPVNMSCGSCGHDFKVHEHVSRDYTICEK